jgi:signal transduction histidine kinase
MIMFRKSKIKIVASIMTIMTLLIAGTFGVIYFSSYREMSDKDERMIDRYIQNYIRDGGHVNPGEKGEHKDNPPHMLEDERAFDIATIYAVSFDGDNNVRDIDNSSQSISNEDLTALAKSALDSDGAKGKLEGYNYQVKNTDDYTLVVLMDSSALDKNASTLLKYTLIFGAVSLAVVFVLSVLLANRIIKPLEKNHEAQKRFISDAGHELKTPVTVISTNAEVLAGEIGGNRWLDNIVYENERMSILIQQLMALTKTDKTEIKHEKVDFSHVIIGEILPFESVAFDKGIEIDYDRIEDDICVNGNTSQLSQLVSILIDNAIEHSTGGDIEVKLSKIHNKAVLTVINNGDEIPQEKRSLLFDRFYRVNEARNDDGGNHYGLGLSIAKSIVDAHKGEISVDCREGKVIFEVSIKIV